MDTDLHQWFENKTILFLAKHAPEQPTLDKRQPENLYYDRYHTEVYSLLDELPCVTIASSDPSILLSRGSQFDYIFSLFNRIPSRNGEVLVSAVCEFLGKPYLGAPPNVRAVAQDKHLAKIVASRAGVRVAPWVRWKPNINQTFEGPFFVKPRFGAASSGITEDSYQLDWKGAVAFAAELSSTVGEPIIESFIDGRNVTLPIIGDQHHTLFDPVEIQVSSRHNEITEDIKLSLNQSNEYVLYSGNQESKIRSAGEKIMTALESLDYCRIDFRVDDATENTVFLEVNICCDISSTGSFMFSALNRNNDYRGMISKIIRSSLWRANVI